jgi:2,4-dienoyl-CoA reductase (NADPH2)
VYPTLLSPLTLGPLTLRNRVVLSGMTTGFGFEDGVPDEDAIAYFRARSDGPAAVVVGFGAVAPGGRVEQRIPWMWRPDAAAAMAPLAAAIRGRGAEPGLQLGHGGRQAPRQVTGSQPVAPSPVPPRAHVREAPHALSQEEIAGLVAAYAHAARAAAEAGFSLLEVHAGHGYLIGQFLSPDSNLRRDGYGGADAAARARFGAEVVAAVRAAAPGACVTVRMNGSDHVPGGLTLDDAVAAAPRFAQAGAHGLVVSGGVYGSVPYSIPLLDDPEGIFLGAAARVRAAVAIPVIGVGRIVRPEAAEAALQRGDCDAVALGRALIADPAWVAKAAAGLPEAIRPCIATVQGCAGMLQHGDAISCSVNPEVGRERRPPAPRARRAQRVVVVGGGPAGMEAACRAAELGHRAVLLERREALGGALLAAALTPVLAHLSRLVAWYERRLREAGAEVRLGVEAGGAEVAALDPALAVVATGAASAPPVLDGYEDLPAWTLEDLLGGGPSSLGTAGPPERPVVLGGGQRGLAASLWLAGRGAAVTVVSGARPGADTSGLAARALLARLEGAGGRVVPGRPERLTAAGVVTREGADERLVPGDAVVIAEPLHPVRPAGLDAGAAVAVGDARRPRDIASAVAEAREVVEAHTIDAAAARS